MKLLLANSHYRPIPDGRLSSKQSFNTAAYTAFQHLRTDNTRPQRSRLRNCDHVGQHAAGGLTD